MSLDSPSLSFLSLSHKSTVTVLKNPSIFFFFCRTFFLLLFLLFLIKLTKKKACWVWAQRPPRLSCGKRTVNRGRSHPWGEDTHIQQTHTHTHTDQRATFLRWCQRQQMNRACLEEQRGSWWDLGDGGEKQRGIAQGDMALVWPVSRPPALEHERGQVVYTPVKKATIATAAPGCYLG